MNTDLKELTKYTDFHHKMCEENKHRTVYKIEVTRDNNKTALTVDPITIFLISISLVKLRKS